MPDNLLDGERGEFPVVIGNHNPAEGKPGMAQVDVASGLMVNRETRPVECGDDLPGRECWQPLAHAETLTRIFSCISVASTGIGSPSLINPSR